MERRIKLTDDDLLIVADALRVRRTLPLLEATKNRVMALEEDFRSRIETEVLTAAERGRELTWMRLIDIPPPALEFAFYFCKPGERKSEYLDYSFTIYAECVEGLSGDLATDEHRKWFDNQKETS